MHRDDLAGAHEKKLSPAARSVRATALLFGMGMGLLVLAVAVILFSGEWPELKNRYRFWRAGAKPLVWEKHRGFQLDLCAGAAPSRCPCVWFVHGMGDSLSTWRKFFVEPGSWNGLPVRLFAVDLPGHGGSLRRKETTEYRVSRMAAELDAEIAKDTLTSEELRIGRGAGQRCRKNVLVGNSFGGWVAALMAERSPRRYAKLVLISPGGTAAADEATRDLFRDVTVESLREFQARAYFRPRELSDSEWKVAVRRVRASGTGEIRAAQVLEDRLDGRLAKLRVPATLVWGEADRILPRAAMEPFLRQAPAVRFRALPECGHLPQKECPAALAEILREQVADGTRSAR